MTQANRVGPVAVGFLAMLVPLAPALAGSPDRAATGDTAKAPPPHYEDQQTVVPSTGPTTSPVRKPLQVDRVLASLNKHMADAAALTDAQRLKLDEMATALRATYGPEIDPSKLGDLVRDYSRAMAKFLTPQQIATLAPRAAKGMETANRVLCASHLKLIGVGILLYSNDHRNAYPPDLGTLFTSGKNLDPTMFLCPDRQKKIPADFKRWTPDKQAAWINANADYVYRGAGMTSLAGADAVVAFDEPANHLQSAIPNDDGGGNILFGNGQVQFLGPARFAPATKPVPPNAKPVAP